MKIFAISDLHLSFELPKPMEKFGDNWKEHFLKIKKNWQDCVHETDIVLIPGDISWALKYEDTIPDIKFISGLPGRKIVIKGNHDYWWPSIKKLREDAFENMDFIQNDIIELGDVAISGTRLWSYPFIKWHNFANGLNIEEDKMIDQVNEKQEYDHVKIRNREVERLRLCLSKIQVSTCRLRVFMTHFPPVGADFEDNEITQILSEHKINLCVFGHLHNIDPCSDLDCNISGVRYVLATCDYLDFKPKLVLEI